MSANGIDGGDKGKEDDVISINSSFSSISNPGRWSDPVFTDEEDEEEEVEELRVSSKQEYFQTMRMNEDDSDDEDDEELRVSSKQEYFQTMTMNEDDSDDEDDEDFQYSTTSDDDDDVDTSDDDDDANAATVSLQRTMTDFFQPVVQNKSAVSRGRRAKKRRSNNAETWMMWRIWIWKARM